MRAAISRPWQSSLPQKTIGTTPRPRLIGSQILWLSLFGGQPIVAHGVGVPSNHSSAEFLYLRDGTAANRTMWF